jgi:tRNA 5-methylaminomethyl-2-thiouridine biosynthesis bifunctional protein
MGFRPIVPAQIEWDVNGVPFSPVHRDVYHPRAGAAGQARHVFVEGNGLPARWQGRDRFVILEAGFGLGNNFLATWQAWRDDPQRCKRLHFISIEQHPLSCADLARAHADSPSPELAAALLDAWPPLTPDLHCLEFDAGQVQLLLALGDVRAWLPQLAARVDAFYLDGFAPARNPAMWEPRIFRALARLAAPSATLATWTVARSVREGLTSAGFSVSLAQGYGGKREMLQARFEPRFAPRHGARFDARAAPIPSPQQPTTAQTSARDPKRHAVIVGAGLAGCATAWALAQQGWTSVLIDRQAQPAQEASGNPAGAFHGTVNPQDGAHARFNRSSALHAERVIAQAMQAGVAGQRNGLLRLERASADVAAMRAMLRALGLPPNYVQALDPAQASARSGVKFEHPAWFYPGAGWVDPVALARYFLQQCGSACTFRGGIRVASIERSGDAWIVADASGTPIEQAQVLVLANAGGAQSLINSPDSLAWPLQSLRGQLSSLPVASLPVGSKLPNVPITGDGFVLPAHAGQLTFGASSALGDPEPEVRASDHVGNLQALLRLCGLGSSVLASALQGRVGWRCASGDRLPLIGAVPASQAGAATETRTDQARFVPREAGLYVFIGLGSRGITWSALGARLLACTICGSPAPLPTGLIDAVDPARFRMRRARRAAAERANQGEGG